MEPKNIPSVPPDLRQSVHLEVRGREVVPVVHAPELQQHVVEWYIKLFLGVHFAANWVSVH